MSLGICMKAFNSLYFRRYIDFFFEFLPQIILLWSLFGWMDFLIFVKWLTPWEVPCRQTGSRFDSSEAPSIITIIINMFLKGGAFADGETYLIGSDASEGQPQKTASIALVLIFLISIPIMLLVKPLYLKFTMKPHEEHHEDHDQHAVNTSNDDSHEEKGMVKTKDKAENIDLDRILKEEFGKEEHHNFGEIFIHQLIETIEFALGSISNTASYLRLWALSLAHG